MAATPSSRRKAEQKRLETKEVGRLNPSNLQFNRQQESFERCQRVTIRVLHRSPCTAAYHSKAHLVLRRRGSTAQLVALPRAKHARLAPPPPPPLAPVHSRRQRYIKPAADSIVAHIFHTLIRWKCKQLPDFVRRLAEINFHLI